MQLISETDWGAAAGKNLAAWLDLAACGGRLSRAAFLMWRKRGGKWASAADVYPKSVCVRECVRAPACTGACARGGLGRVWLASGNTSTKCIQNGNCADPSSDLRSDKRQKFIGVCTCVHKAHTNTLGQPSLMSNTLLG